MEAKQCAESTDSDQSINIERLKEHLIEAFEVTKSAQGKEIVLVIGNTGSGKSTTINYLLEVPLALTEDEYGMESIVANPRAGQKSAKIGQMLTVSETLYPALFTAPSKHNLCDTPGFGDTRGLVEAITAAMSTKAVINNATTIKGIVVLLEYPFTTDRCKTLREMFATLKILLSQSHKANHAAIDPATLSRSILFLANKTKLTGKSIGLFRKIYAEETKNSDEAAENIKFMCELVLRNPENYIEVAPLDQGKTRALIIDKINQSRPLSPRAFGIPADATTKRALTEMISQICTTGIDLLRDLQSLPEELTRFNNMHATESARLAELEGKLLDLENNAQSAESEQGTETLSNLIANVKERIMGKNDELISVQKEISILNDKLARLSSTEEVISWSDTYDEQKIFGVVSQYVINHHTFLCDGKPFSRARFNRSGEGSVYEVLENSPANGRYKVKFSTGPLFYGIGVAEVYTRLCDLPENREQANNLSAELERCNQRMQQLQGDRTSLEQHETELENRIVELEIAQMKSAQEYKTLLTETILKDRNACQDQLRTIDQQILDLTQRLSIAKDVYPKQKTAIDIVRQITTLIDDLYNPRVDELLNLAEVVNSTPILFNRPEPNQANPFGFFAPPAFNPHEVERTQATAPTFDCF